MLSKDEKELFEQLRPRLQKLRSDKGLTQERLAAEAGLDRAHISWIEQGRRNPNLVTLYRISRVLGTNLSDLLKGIK